MADGKITKRAPYEVDLSDMAGDAGAERVALCHIARTAEAAERYEDMRRFMRQLVIVVDNNGMDLTVEERNLLSVAYKNVIGLRRSSWRMLCAAPEEYPNIIAGYKKQVEAELEEICADVLELLEKRLIANAKKNRASVESEVFYKKMAGDYYRYRAESVKDQGYEKKSAAFYGEAYKHATTTDSLLPTHPIRLGLALNYSVCFYEILKDKAKACELAKEAFDSAISKLDKLPEGDYKDSTLIMQLLRDNLTLWTSEDDVSVEDLDA